MPIPTVATPLRRCSLLTLAILAACATPPPTPPIAVVAAPPVPPTPVNGTYNGIMQLRRGPAISCGDQDLLTLSVANNAFSYTLNQPQVPWQPVRSFSVAITTDGSFQAQSGAASISGSVSAGHMSGDIIGDACGYHFEADRSGTW